ncbi:C4b-binding protein alpha chain isoform X1 [Monodelphis domestica]|uniref:C4b-binding protein alpha chain isoform X1 n=2 Tax=Monodelphis domestica TaxID=13616 RepID=UPI0024E1D422|nr:C4b-binding protein alpha chain isoform X1 [Monodelphis domestica]
MVPGTEKIWKKHLVTAFPRVTKEMAHRREKWKVHGSTLFQIILSFALLGMVNGTCGFPPTLHFASPESVLDQSIFPEGTQLKYNCRPGYTRSSSRNVLTCRDKSWHFLNPFCIKKRCEHPGELNNGRVIIKTDLDFGSKIEFSCLDGYHLIGSSTSICGISDSRLTWSEPLPVCEIVTCPPPSPISNGKHNGREDNIYTFGSSVTYRCNTPFSLIGEASISCSVVNETIGTWNPPPPNCKIVVCNQPQISNGNMVSGLRSTYTYKDTILFECKKGYLLHGSSLIHCGADNNWIPALPNCVLNSCLSPPHIENAELSSPHLGYEGEFPVGTLLTFACRYGYKAVPDRPITAVCQEDFKWQVDEGVCKRICCPSPQIDHGKFLGFTDECIHFPRNSFTIPCKRKSKRSICQGDGTWKPAISSCEDKEDEVCNSPKAIPNGDYKKTSSLFSSEVTVNYSCNDGYVMIGNAEITCKYSRWSHPFPRCGALCPKPEIPNGKLSPENTRYISTQTVNVQCSHGYNLVGPQNITCSDDRSWTPEVPKCEWEFPEGCEKVSAGYRLMQCLPNAQDVKMALEIYKIALEIEMLKLELDKKEGTYQKPSLSPAPAPAPAPSPPSSPSPSPPSSPSPSPSLWNGL